MTLAIDAYEELDELPEPLLLHAYRRTLVRSEPCACGGVLRQHAGEGIDEIVRMHNETQLHRAWSAHTRWVP